MKDKNHSIPPISDLTYDELKLAAKNPRRKARERMEALKILNDIERLYVGYFGLAEKEIE